MRNFIICTISLGALSLFACNSNPKVIEAESTGAQSNTPIFQDPASNTAATAPAQNTGEVHKIVPEEVLNTEKYSYMRVKENGEEFWVAVTRQDVKIGGHYVYTGGLLKKNFMSKEFNRVFETVYLVADFREEGASMPAAQGGGMLETKEALAPPTNLTPAPGAIKISELVAHKAKYNGKTVKVTGKCVKLNPMIMGRNWLHIQDGSGKDLDLTVTTSESVQLGSIITLEGTIALNKDFGAGYRYDYIMEGAVVVK